MADRYMPLKNEIYVIREGNYPIKVIDEGDSLDLGAVIHSFYWNFDNFYKRHDYEPVAKTRDQICLTRFHNHGIVIWEKYTLRENKPIVYFPKGPNTPILCSKQKIWFITPSDAMDRAFLKGYFLGKVKQLQEENQSNYKVDKYFNIIVDEVVPNESKFTWEKLEYYVIVGSSYHLKDITSDSHLIEKLEEVVIRSAD